jgi:hypothetical protein
MLLVCYIYLWIYIDKLNKISNLWNSLNSWTAEAIQTISFNSNFTLVFLHNSYTDPQTNSYTILKLFFKVNYNSYTTLVFLK